MNTGNIISCSCKRLLLHCAVLVRQKHVHKFNNASTVFYLEGTLVTNKEIGTIFDDLHLLMLHSLAHCEVLCSYRDAVSCIYNCIFMGRELLSSSP